ncbi:MAG: hypothetical protein LBQ48_00070, partial [Oscillospiraceae bacterium]|nr:hypothetical protein [Oscillospiraceae bacterium]
MNKTLIYAVLVASLLLGLCSCKTKPDITDSADPPGMEFSAPSSAPPETSGESSGNTAADTFIEPGAGEEPAPGSSTITGESFGGGASANSRIKAGSSGAASSNA